MQIAQSRILILPLLQQQKQHQPRQNCRGLRSQGRFLSKSFCLLTHSDIRPHEKLASAPPAPSVVSAQSASASPPAPDSEQPQQTGWEEPTTVQAPVWEEEPPNPSISTPDSWTAAEEPHEQNLEQEQPLPAEMEEADKTPAPSQQEEAPAPKEVEPQPPVPIQPPVLVPVAATPSPKLAGRSTASSHRIRHKTTDQPVVMPNSFGATIEKVGMQFGSLSLGGDSLDNNL